MQTYDKLRCCYPMCYLPHGLPWSLCLMSAPTTCTPILWNLHGTKAKHHYCTKGSPFKVRTRTCGTYP